MGAPVFSFTLRDARPLKTYPLSFFVGDDLGSLELRNISWQMGGAVKGWQREFEHGLVLVNPTLQPQDFAVTGTFKRIRGTQDAAHNNGEPVGRTLTVAPAATLTCCSGLHEPTAADVSINAELSIRRKPL